MGFESRFAAMGTVVEQLVNGPEADRAAAVAQDEVERLESMLSAFRPDSDVSRLNRNAGQGWVPIGRETLEVLEAALYYAEASDGAFDPTMGSAVRLWRAGSEGSVAPPRVEVEAALSVVGYKGLDLDPMNSSARLASSGQMVDLGAIGKGYASDKVRELYCALGISSAFVNLGGNVVALGSKPDGSPWTVGVRHPRADGQRLIGVLSVSGKAVVTSGDYFRYFMGSDGRRCHHILDPQTGEPSESGLVSVTVVSESATAADALSTAAFVMGLVDGSRLIKSFGGTEAIFITSDGSAHVTSGLLGCYHTL